MRQVRQRDSETHIERDTQREREREERVRQSETKTDRERDRQTAKEKQTNRDNFVACKGQRVESGHRISYTKISFSCACFLYLVGWHIPASSRRIEYNHIKGNDGEFETYSTADTPLSPGGGWNCLCCGAFCPFLLSHTHPSIQKKWQIFRISWRLGVLRTGCRLLHRLPTHRHRSLW
jgi:hypothetical protein